MSEEGTPLKLEVTANQIKNFVAEAILHQLDDATKEAMIQNALTHLVTQPKGRHGETLKAPLVQAYDRAVFQEVTMQKRRKNACQ